MKTLQSEKGAVLVLELIILAAVLAAAGFAAYTYMHNKNSVNQKAAVVSHQASPSPSAVPGNVLEIKELGIQMTLPPGLSKSDVYYVADSTPHVYQDGNGKSYHVLGKVALSTHSLTAAASGCTASANGGLISFSKEQEDLGKGYMIASADTSYEKVGDFYMSIADRQSPCSWKGNAVDPLENSQYGLFVQAFQTAKPL